MRNEIYPKVFMWMFIGLAITFGTGFFLSINETMVEGLIKSGMFFIVVIAEVVIAIFFGVRIQKMSYTTALISYLLYAFLTGLSFGLIFLAYNLTSIISVFAITSVLFLVFAIYGYTTKRDLNSIGTFLFMGLIGIIICSVVGIFVHNSTFDIIINILGVAIFLGYTAYDINKISMLTNYIDEDKVAVYGAFELFLDFINLFMHLLELFGDSND